MRQTPSGFVMDSVAIAPHSERGGYIVFMASDDDNRVEANYGDTYDRLVEVKRGGPPWGTCSGRTRT